MRSLKRSLIGRGKKFRDCSVIMRLLLDARAGLERGGRQKRAPWGGEGERGKKKANEISGQEGGREEEEEGGRGDPPEGVDKTGISYSGVIRHG